MNEKYRKNSLKKRKLGIGTTVSILLLTLVIVAMVMVPNAVAVPGDVLASFHPSPNGDGRAVAHDPATGEIYWTNEGDNHIYVVDTTGNPIRTLSPDAVYGSLSWDAKRKVLWGGHYDGTGDVDNIDPITGVATHIFTFAFKSGDSCYGVNGYIDGLAYDGDDSLWLSDDGGTILYHTDLSGGLISSSAISSGRCNNGITVDDKYMWLALQSGKAVGPHDIVRVDKTNPTVILSSFQYSANSPGAEDIELDVTTFPGKCAIWTNQFTENDIKALELEKGIKQECGGSISGTKFEDVNHNGVFDSGEPGLKGWTIVLTKPDGTTEKQVTDSNGNYKFTEVDGVYTVGEEIQPGYIQTTPAISEAGSATYSVTLSGGNDVVGKDFGNYKLGEVKGEKFNDLNGNGIKDQEDTGLSGWQINLVGTDTITGKPVSKTTTTDPSGNYQFPDLTAGTYTVSEVMQPGYIQTAPGASQSGTASYTVTISGSGTVVTGQDFGNFKLGEVDGQKFEDLNANGIKDANFVSETGLAGWDITISGIDTITNTPVSKTVTTDANGNYQFTGLTAGTYTITETPQDGWVQTAPSGGSYTVIITSESVIKGQDFGNFHKGKITGGGWIPAPGDPKATFGLVGQYPDSKSAAQGNVEYQDHSAKLDIKSTEIDTVATTLDKKKGVITGFVQVNGAGKYYFEVYVEDNAEPGKDIDVFKISIPGLPYLNGAVLSSGNIQIHE